MATPLLTDPDLIPTWRLCWIISTAAGLIRILLAPPRRTSWRLLVAEVGVGNVATFSSLGLVEHYVAGITHGFLFSVACFTGFTGPDLLVLARTTLGRLADALIYRVRGANEPKPPVDPPDGLGGSGGSGRP